MDWDYVIQMRWLTTTRVALFATAAATAMAIPTLDSIRERQQGDIDRIVREAQLQHSTELVHDDARSSEANIEYLLNLPDWQRLTSTPDGELAAIGKWTDKGLEDALLTEAGLDHLEEHGIPRDAAHRYDRRFKNDIIFTGFSLLPEVHQACGGDPNLANAYDDTYSATDIIIFCNECITPAQANSYDRAQWLTKPAPSYSRQHKEGAAGRAIAALVHAGITAERANPYAELNGKYRLRGPCVGPEEIIAFERENATFAEVETTMREPNMDLLIMHDYDRERAKHTVEPGETLWSIARDYLTFMGVTPIDTREIHAQADRIATLNGMGTQGDFPWHPGYTCLGEEDPNCIQPGEILDI